MSAVYIVLTDTGTLFTRIIRCFTGARYNHASLALDPSLATIYSFGRKSLRLPWRAGFVIERPDAGLFRKQRNTTCAVYELRIDDGQRRRMEHRLRRFERDAARWHYNFLGLFNFLLGLHIRRRNAYFCSEFVASVLLGSGVRLIGKPPGRTAPHDFMRAASLSPVYEGKLSEYARFRSARTPPA